MSKFLNSILNILTNEKSPLDAQQKAELTRLVEQESGIPPKIAVIGKAGVGKTTTVNNLFKAEFKVSHTVTGTTAAQWKEYSLEGGGKLMIVDMPGLGESLENDLIFEPLYRQILPEVDIILYVCQANERYLGEDQRILQDVVLDSVVDLREKIVIGLNQVDKIGPGEWNVRLNAPTAEQEESIERRCSDLTHKFSEIAEISRDQIEFYSATKRYRLLDLLHKLLKASENRAWKLPVDPADPWELADPDIQAYVAEQQIGELQ